MNCVSSGLRCSLLLFLASQTLATPAGKNENGTSGPIDTQKCNNVYFYEAANTKIETILQEVKKQLAQMQNDINIIKGRTNNVSRVCKFDFEDGIDGWIRTGTVFNNQPTYGDNPTARNNGQPANQQGHWWIGGYENRPSKAAPAGRNQGDGPQGTLTSASFNIRGKYISFLIGGGCDIKLIRAELIIGHKVVKTSTGKCNETMTRKHWDVGAFIGQRARVKLVDFSSASWGHINFDDLRGDITCGRN